VAFLPRNVVRLSKDSVYSVVFSEFIVNTDSLKSLDVLLAEILYILPLCGSPDTPASLVAQHLLAALWPWGRLSL
jgi:hypothetical protein